MEGEDSSEEEETGEDLERAWQVSGAPERKGEMEVEGEGCSGRSQNQSECGEGADSEDELEPGLEPVFI